MVFRSSLSEVKTHRLTPAEPDPGAQLLPCPLDGAGILGTAVRGGGDAALQ